jgi:hypothetical protein
MLYAAFFTEEKHTMLLEDDIRLIAGLYGWKLVLRRLHPDNPIYLVYIFWRRRKHCLGFLRELQCMTAEQLIDLIHSYAEPPR